MKKQMTCKEPLETVILQKLEAMEDRLKSFLSSLEELPQKKGLSVPVFAPTDGIIQWRKRDGATVEVGDLLCVIESAEYPGRTEDVVSWAEGTLNIRAGQGQKVKARWIIATIGLRSHLV